MKTIRLAKLLLLLGPLYAAPPELIGPFGGSAAIIKVDSRRPGTVITATSNALLFRSTDDGNSWARLPFPAELRATLHAFAVVPWTGVYLVGVASDAHEYSGMFASANGGKTWSRVRGLAGKDIWSIAVWQENPKVIAAGAADGVFLTSDSGEHWARISPLSNPALMPVVSLDFDPRDSRVLYAGTPHLPWKTTDSGATWLPARSGMLDDSDVFSIHVDLIRSGRVFASTCGGLYRSLNGAGTWTKLTGAKDASDRTYYIAQHPTQSNVLLAGTTHGLVKSMDGGETWRKLSSQPTRWIAFDPAQPGRIYTATDEAGIFRSDDLGESFRSINEGFSTRHVVSLAALGATLYVNAPGGFAEGSVFRNTNLTEEWTKIDSISPSREQQVLQVVPFDPSHLYLLTSRSVLVSSDFGQTWTDLGSPTSSKLTALLVPKSAGNRLLVAAGASIYHTEDGAQTWEQALIPQEHSAITSLIAVGQKAIVALAGSSVFLSSVGAEFKRITSPGVDAEIHGLVETDNGDLLVATSRGLRRSEDFGETWRPVRGVLDGSTISTIYKHPTHHGVIFAARYGTIFVSEDDGLQWTPITSAGDELPAIRDLVVAPGIPDSIFAITQLQGVYAVPLNHRYNWTACKGRHCGVIRIQNP